VEEPAKTQDPELIEDAIAEQGTFTLHPSLSLLFDLFFFSRAFFNSMLLQFIVIIVLASTFFFRGGAGAPPATGRARPVSVIGLAPLPNSIAAFPPPKLGNSQPDGLTQLPSKSPRLASSTGSASNSPRSTPVLGASFSTAGVIETIAKPASTSGSSLPLPIAPAMGGSSPLSPRFGQDDSGSGSSSSGMTLVASGAPPTTGEVWNLMQKPQDQLTVRENVIREIFNTEKDYVHKLSQLVEVSNSTSIRFDWWHLLISFFSFLLFFLHRNATIQLSKENIRTSLLLKKEKESTETWRLSDLSTLNSFKIFCVV
jgi:hypothetical protein